MVDTKIEAQEQILRHRVSDFLGKQTRRRRPMQSVLQNVFVNQWPAYLFGGVARDLLQRGLTADVRDVDELLQIQCSHYGRVVLNAELLTDWFAAADEQHRTDRQGKVRLPSCSEQLTLPHQEVATQLPGRSQDRLAALYTAYATTKSEQNEKVPSLEELRRKYLFGHPSDRHGKHTGCSAQITRQESRQGELFDLLDATQPENR